MKKTRYFIVIIALFSFGVCARADTSGLVQAQKAYFDGLRSGKYTTQAQRNELAAETIGAAQAQYDRAMNAQWKNAIQGAVQPGAYQKEVLEPSLWQSLTSMFHIDGKSAPKDAAAAGSNNTFVVQPSTPQGNAPDSAVDGNGIPRLIEFGGAKRAPASR